MNCFSDLLFKKNFWKFKVEGQEFDKKYLRVRRNNFRNKNAISTGFFFVVWDLGGKSHNVRCSINYRPILFYPRKEFRLDFIGETRPPLLCQKHPRIADFIPWFLRHSTLYSINKNLIWISSYFRAPEWSIVFVPSTTQSYKYKTLLNTNGN